MDVADYLGILRGTASVMKELCGGRGRACSRMLVVSPLIKAELCERCASLPRLLIRANEEEGVGLFLNMEREDMSEPRMHQEPFCNCGYMSYLLNMC